jgi:hypothetical protein
MTTGFHNREFWPTRQQELLLRAALLEGKEALKAWQEYGSYIDIRKLDPGSLRILPLLYRNLSSHGVKHPQMREFRAVYRLMWFKNQMLFHNMAPLLRSFHDAGMQTMILKGAALTLLHYGDYGLRPMNDFDVLIQKKQASAAIQLLMKLGWTSIVSKQPEAFTERYLRAKHAHMFKNSADHALDLHWYTLDECRYEGADDDFWYGAVSVRVQDVSTYALNPTDQLLHTCVHGAQVNSVPPFRWVADATTIISTSQPEIDWNRLVGQARKRHLILPLRDTLSYLRDVIHTPIPSAVMQDIQSMPIARGERILYEAKSRPNAFRNLCLLYLSHSQSLNKNNASLVHKLVQFPRFLQDTLELKGLWEVLFFAILKAGQRTRKMTVRFANKLASSSLKN